MYLDVFFYIYNDTFLRSFDIAFGINGGPEVNYNGYIYKILTVQILV